VLTPVPLSGPNFAVHKATYGKALPRRVKVEIWLGGVLDAMEKQELEDPMHKSWDLNSKPEERVVGRKDRPLDEWNDMITRRNV
jgi:hypothetical protein